MLARIHPADRAVWLILAIAVLVCLARVPGGAAEVWSSLLVHAALLAGFTAYVAFAATSQSRWIAQAARPAVSPAAG